MINKKEYLNLDISLSLLYLQVIKINRSINLLNSLLIYCLFYTISTLTTKVL